MLCRLLLPFFVFAAAAAHADFAIRTEVDAQKVGVQDQVVLTLTVSGTSMPDQVPMPSLANLRVAGGPMQSSQTSFVNGVMSQSITHTFVLQPLSVGRAEIGEVRIKSGTTDHVAPPIALEILAGSVRPRATAPPADPWDPFGGPDPFEPFRRRGRGVEPKLHVETTAVPARVHVGEPVLFTYYLYTQTSVTDMRFTEPPKYTGFWSEQLEKPLQVPGGEPVTLGGETFRRFPLFQKLLFPTKAGAVTIPPATLRIGVPQLGGFFGSRGVDAVERATKPVTITVDPIPEEPGFSGAVGRFSTRASLDKTNVGLGEAISLRFEVQGTGNLKWVDRAPEVSVAGAKVYPPQVKSDLRMSVGGISGTKTWEFIVVPETSGALEVPALTFGYFDLATRQLVHSTTAPLTAQVQGGAGAAGSVPLAPAPMRAGSPLPLRSDLDRPAGLPVLSARVLVAMMGLVLLAHAALWGAPWLLERRSDTTAQPGRTRSTRRVLADLQRVGHDGMSKEASVALIEKTLHEVFGPLDETSTEPEGERERAARQVLQDVYFIRYAPQLGDYSEPIRDVARRAAEVVRRWA